MILLGLLTAIVAPRVNFIRYRMESAMLGVGTILVAAQRQALSRQHDVIVTFDVPNQMIYVHGDANNDGLVDAGERRRGHPIGETVVFGLGAATARPMGAGPVTFSQLHGGLRSLTFHRNGTASEAAGFYLTSLRGVAGTHPEDTRAIEVERSTGRMSWYRFGTSGWQRGF